MRWVHAANLILPIAAGLLAAQQLSAAPPVSPAPPSAAPEARPQIAAATASAIDHLRTDIQAEPITPTLSVRQFLEHCGAQLRLDQLIREQSQPIGGARWLDEQTCQVRVDLPASAVRQELQHIAADNPQTAPLSPADVARDLAGWDARVFSATGTSTAAIDAIRPPPASTAWRDVAPADVRNAVQAARQDAVTRVLASVEPVPLSPGRKIADALAVPDIRNATASWIATRPITLVDFRDDRRVDLTLALTAQEFSGKLRAILAPRADVPHPFDDASWAAISQAVARQMAPPTGQGSASADPAAPAIVLPAQPPDWVERQLDAEGTGAGQGHLRATRAAEVAAAAQLREQINKLPIGNGKTLADAAAHNPTCSAAIDRAIARDARVYKIDYPSDDSATVRMSLDLQRLWESLNSPR